MIAMSEELESKLFAWQAVRDVARPVAPPLSNPTIRPAYDFQGKSTARLGRLLHTLPMNPVQRDDATAYAMKQAIALVARGDLEATLSILESPTVARSPMSRLASRRAWYDLRLVTRSPQSHLRG